MKKYRAIDWAVDALYAQLEQLSIEEDPTRYELTLDAINALTELKRDLPDEK